jgi:type VI secretion system protein ImpL
MGDMVQALALDVSRTREARDLAERALAAQREADVPGRADARSQLLRFEFPLVASAPDGKALPTESRARVFLRLSVSAPGKRAPLAWPGAFPTRAPEWAAN